MISFPHVIKLSLQQGVKLLSVTLAYRLSADFPEMYYIAIYINIEIRNYREITFYPFSAP